MRTGTQYKCKHISFTGLQTYIFCMVITVLQISKTCKSMIVWWLLSKIDLLQVSVQHELNLDGEIG